MKRVTCLCPTFNRVEGYQHLVEEAIQSFLVQDYPETELLLFNDCPDQTLTLDLPGQQTVTSDHTETQYLIRKDKSDAFALVRFFNFKQRFPTLGAKYNAMVRNGSGDLFCPWEDDDIALSWRISLSVEKLGDCDYYNPKASWFLDSNGLHHTHPQGYNHNSSLYTRKAWEQVGGYEDQKLDGSQDANMDTKLLQQVRVARHPRLPEKEWYYIYRWGVSNCHLSAYGGDFYARLGQYPRALSGDFILCPEWKQDYLKLTQDYLAAHNL